MAKGGNKNPRRTPAYNHIFVNKHLRGTVSRRFQIKEKTSNGITEIKLEESPGRSFIKTYKHLFLKTEIKPTFPKRKLFKLLNNIIQNGTIFQTNIKITSKKMTNGGNGSFYG